MVEYLREHASEVTNMLYAEWDMDKALSVERVEGREEGRVEGRAEGIVEGRADIVRKMKSKQMTPKEIADLTGFTIEEIRKL
jgi:predicted transposase/invertase (TIGR01784 family)